MMLSISAVLLLAAIVMTLYHSAVGKVPLWVPLLLVEIVLALQIWPGR